MAVRRLAAEQPASFAFTPANQAWAEAKVRDYPEGRQASAVIPILWKAQEQHHGWLPEPAIRLVADMLGMPYIRVFEVATFYTMFQLAPVGRVAHVNVCGTTPCMLRGSDDILAVCRKRIAPRPHEPSDDGKFSWEEVECAGACVNAPMVQIGKDNFEDLTAQSFEALLDALAAGRPVTPGPQSARKSSEPITGATTLTSPYRHAAPGGEDALSASPDTDFGTASPSAGVATETPSAGVDPSSPAAAGQQAALPSGSDRPEVEATQLSDAPPREASPVAPEPQTSGQPGGVDEPERQKSAHDSDSPDDRPVGDAADAAASAATGTTDAAPDAPAAPTTGVEQAEPAPAADQAQADRAAPGAQYADHAPERGGAPQSPPAGAAPTEAGTTHAVAAPQSPPAGAASGEAAAAVDHEAAGASASDDAAAEARAPADVAARPAPAEAVGGAAPAESERSNAAAPAEATPAGSTEAGHVDDTAASGEPEPAAATAASSDVAPATGGDTVESEIVDVAPPAPGTAGDLTAAEPEAEVPPAPDAGAAARADEAGRRPAAARREDFSELDNLQRISGIGPVIEKTLHNLGIFSFAQIAAWDQANKDWLATYLSFKGRIDRERWVEQAQALAAADGAG